MLQIERQNGIVEFVQKHGLVSVEDIMAEFGISRSTARRDILELNDLNIIRRTRGGAASIEHGTYKVPAFKYRKNLNLDEKKRIGEAALRFIQEQDTVLLDEGSTTLELARRLDRFQSLVVATYDLNIAEVMKPMHGINLVVSGGSYKERGNTVIGYFTTKFFEEIKADRCFIAADAVSLEQGCMCCSMDEIMIKKTMLKSSREVILLADHSKFERLEFVRFCELDKLKAVITGKEVDPEILQGIRDLGVEVITV